jgi:hypothetical protein
LTESPWGWLSGLLSGLAAIVVAAIGFLLLRKKPTATSLPEQAKAEKEFAKTVESAQREFEAEKVAVEAKKEEAEAAVIHALEEKSGPLLEDGDALTEHLKKAGEQARNGP